MELIRRLILIRFAKILSDFLRHYVHLIISRRHDIQKYIWRYLVNKAKDFRYNKQSCTQGDGKSLASSKGLHGLAKYLLRACHLLAKGVPDTNKCYKTEASEAISANYLYLCPTIDKTLSQE